MLGISSTSIQYSIGAATGLETKEMVLAQIIISTCTLTPNNKHLYCSHCLLMVVLVQL
jgi:hypothetical protein